MTECLRNSGDWERAVLHGVAALRLPRYQPSRNCEKMLQQKLALLECRLVAALDKNFGFSIDFIDPVAVLGLGALLEATLVCSLLA